MELTIDQLLLDQENPRLGLTLSQSETLEKLILLNPSQFRALMASIRDEGLDPGDSLYVIASDDNDDDFVVLEGNRRLSALKVLNSPDLLAATDLPRALVKRLVGETGGFNQTDVEPIRCVRFEDREQANEWIRRRHTGIAKGEGRINWRPLDIQRFSNDYTTVDVIEFVGRNAGYTDQEWEKAHAALGGGKSTNLTRLLDSAAGRQHIGLSVKTTGGRRTPILGSKPKWALNVLKRMVDDIVSGKVDSRSLNRASDIEKYFEDLPIELQPNESSTVDKPKDFRSINLTGSSTEARKKPPTRRSTAPRKRTTLAPKKHTFDSASSTKLAMLVNEASGLNIEKFPFSAALVLRSIVELTVNDYMRVNKLPLGKKGEQQQYNLTKKANDVVEHLKQNSELTNSDLSPFRNRILTPTSMCSIQSLNGFAHNQYSLPSADDLRAGWEALLPILIGTYGSP